MLRFLSCMLIVAIVAGQPDPSLYGLSYSADDSTLKTFGVGITPKELERLVSEGKGDWTEWLDGDYPMPWGTGEFENVLRNRVEDVRNGRCLMWCVAPKAMELKLSNDHVNLTTSSLEAALHCPVTESETYNPLDGYTCSNFQQLQQRCDSQTCMQNGLGYYCEYCPDMQIRYFCTGPRDCLQSAKRSLDVTDKGELEKTLGRVNAEDMMITLDSWDSPKRKLKLKRAQESEATDLLTRLLRAMRSEQ